jgi:hypothetical protein
MSMDAREMETRIKELESQVRNLRDIEEIKRLQRPMAITWSIG